MFFALNDQGIRIHASNADSNACYTCPACGETVRHRKGPHNKWHFAHRPHSDCVYGKDKDYDHEWHMRMQEYFPPELREFRFVDPDTKEIHIADVFIPSSNIVLEFQHSSITDEEFKSRTVFHVKNGRRIAWLFDESEKNPKPKHNGKFLAEKMDSTFTLATTPSPYNSALLAGNPYESRYFKWLGNPRKCLSLCPPLESIEENIVICVYTGTENDLFHRLAYIGSDDFSTTVTFSLHDILMSNSMDGEEFFIPEKIHQESGFPEWFCNFDYLRALHEEEKVKSLSKPARPSFYARPYRRSRRL